MTEKEGQGIVYISKSPVSFSGQETSVAFSAFDRTTYEQPPVQAAGYVKGNITLNDIPNPRPEVRIRAYSEQFDNYSVIDNRGDYYTVNANGSFEIPFVANFLDALKSEDQNLHFELWVGPDEGGFRMSVPASKEVTKSDLTGGNLEVGSLGAVSIASITLSGTISVKLNGQTVPRVEISAYGYSSESEGGSGSISSYITLNAPANGQTWTMTIQKPATDTPVYFSVYGADTNWNQLFSRNNVTSTTVSTQNVSGIVLDLGDIKTVTLSGTVDVTLNGARPYTVEVFACTDLDNRYNTQLGSAYIENYTGSSSWTIQAESSKTDVTVHFLIGMQSTQSGGWTGYQATDVTCQLTANATTPVTGITIKKDYALSGPANSAALRKAR
jgi:hypothetical protein